MSLAVPVEDFQIGRVVSRTFGVFGRNAITFLTVALVVMAPVLALQVWLGSTSYLVVGRSSGWVLGAVAGIVPFVCGYLLQASLVQGTITDLNGEKPSVGRALSTGFAQILAVAIIAIVSLLGMGLGLVLLVVPGLILLTGWSVVIPVRVAEGTTVGDAFRRSWELTSQYRWKIFGVLVIYFIIALVAGFVTRAVLRISLMDAAVMTHNIPLIAVTWITNLLMTVIGAIGVAAIYYELRTVKEGVAPDALVKAFD
jgi:hypothetical protein